MAKVVATAGILLVACGSRSDLSPAPAASAPSSSTSCTDALDPDAFKPVDRYCSDGSNRAHAIAPPNPHVVWSRNVVDPISLLAGADGSAYVTYFSGVSVVELTKQNRWNDMTATPWRTRFLRPGTFDTTNAVTSQRATQLQTNGETISVSPWPKWGARVGMGEDGAAFVELIEYFSIQAEFAGIARTAPDGTTQWIEKGECDPGGGDFPAPHDFVRRDDHLILVCNTHDHDIEVLEVDSNDVEVSKTFVDGSLGGDIALSADGVLHFFVRFDETSSSLVSIAQDGSAELGATLPLASIAAIAHDGTLMARTQKGVAAVSGHTLLWHQAIGPVSDVFVDSDHTVVANGTVVALDVASGSQRWQVSLPPNENVLSLASAGPGKLYALSETKLTLLSD